MDIPRQQRVLRELLTELPVDNAVVRTVQRLSLAKLDAADAESDDEKRAEYLREIRALLDAVIYPTED